MMETGTFPKAEVQEYVGKNYVPVRYEMGRDSEQFMRFAVMATPTCVVLDSEGNEIHRIKGLYRPDEFIKELELARAKLSNAS